MNALAQINPANARQTYDQAKQSASKVYFIATADLRRVKIGTTTDVMRRMNQLQVGSPDKLRIIRVVDGGSPTETWLHTRFAEFRISGEWFSFCEDMFNIIPPDEVPVRRVDRPSLRLTLREHLANADKFDIGAGAKGKLLSVLAKATEDEAAAVLEAVRKIAIPRPSTVDDLFSTLGGPAAVARLIGVSTEHATAMRRRRSIPVDYWPALLESEGGKQINLTSDDLVRVHTSHSKQGDAA